MGGVHPKITNCNKALLLYNYFITQAASLTQYTHHATMPIGHTGEDKNNAYDTRTFPDRQRNCRTIQAFGRDDQTIYQTKETRSCRVREQLSHLGSCLAEVSQQTKRQKINSGHQYQSNNLLAVRPFPHALGKLKGNGPIHSCFTIYCTLPYGKSQGIGAGVGGTRL